MQGAVHTMIELHKDNDALRVRVAELEAAIRDLIAMYAASPNDDDWQHKAVKHARSLVR